MRLKSYWQCNYMREIKFRAWDTEKKIMYYIDLYEYMSFNEEAQDDMITLNARNNGLMQYTGLKDKNGKEIYEGDIVYGYGLVHFIGGRYVIVYDKEMTSFEDLLGDDDEIIGNILETPELVYE